MQYERYRDKRHTEKNSSSSNTMDPLKHVPKKKSNNEHMLLCCIQQTMVLYIDKFKRRDVQVSSIVN